MHLVYIIDINIHTTGIIPRDIFNRFYFFLKINFTEGEGKYHV
jgi:hypothetical protein